MFVVFFFNLFAFASLFGRCGYVDYMDDYDFFVLNNGGGSENGFCTHFSEDHYYSYSLNRKKCQYLCNVSHNRRRYRL